MIAARLPESIAPNVNPGGLFYVAHFVDGHEESGPLDAGNFSAAAACGRRGAVVRLFDGDTGESHGDIGPRDRLELTP